MINYKTIFNQRENAVGNKDFYQHLLQRAKDEPPDPNYQAHAPFKNFTQARKDVEERAKMQQQQQIKALNKDWEQQNRLNKPVIKGIDKGAAHERHEAERNAEFERRKDLINFRGTWDLIKKSPFTALTAAGSLIGGGFTALGWLNSRKNNNKNKNTTREPQYPNYLDISSFSQ